jgi:hypothetical protein
MSVPREVVEKQEELVDLLADLDGCEGGEFLRGLAELARDAWGGGYAYSGDAAYFILNGLIDAEIQAHKDMIYSGHASSYGYEDPEDAKRRIEELEAQ